MAPIRSWFTNLVMVNGLIVTPALAQTQTDLSTCTGNYNYCVEWTRRNGQPISGCESAYRECMRNGSWSRRDPYSPLPGQVPIERR